MYMFSWSRAHLGRNMYTDMRAVESIAWSSHVRLVLNFSHVTILNTFFCTACCCDELVTPRQLQELEVILHWPGREAISCQRRRRSRPQNCKLSLSGFFSSSSSAVCAVLCVLQKLTFYLWSTDGISRPHTISIESLNLTV
jgi:hypothetical protein